ncbi:hypothetical protein GNP94_21990 [Paenibacillus campinasensis]|uniref:Head-tail adaptor protein n=1 Tax=Paenibacillus campinasensis TaxID=66347 RepID=A0ABW9T949_9BACL|nr:hypothetical protein [Paenibacillus campinasensis]MUG68645.1 hypothetical protein [Paenibacillus campinasensis]
MRHRFAPIIRRRSVPYILLMPKDGGEWRGGKYIPAEGEKVKRRGVIQPLGEEISQQDGGRYTKDDRKLFCLSPHNEGDVILYKGDRYTVQSGDDRSDYSDTYQYVLERVTP